MDTRICQLLIDIVKDLENTQEFICGYSYARTIRNILVGKEDAIIAPNFKGKYYHGILEMLSLKETEDMLDYLVKTNQITYMCTSHGKMYCTFEYYKRKCKKWIYV
jgi:hypothetical protein